MSGYGHDHAPPGSDGKTRVGILISGAGSNMAAIIEAAKAEDYPAEIAVVISNNPEAPGLDLARALFASVEVDATIPNEHFKAVAEVIGFVMRLKQGAGWKAN